MRVTVTCDLSEEDVERIRGEYEPGLTDAELVEEAVREYARQIGHDRAYRDVFARRAKVVHWSEIEAGCDAYDAAHPAPEGAPVKRFPSRTELDELVQRAEQAAERAERAVAAAAPTAEPTPAGSTAGSDDARTTAGAVAHAA